jgi:hypothetical protein
MNGAEQIGRGYSVLFDLPDAALMVGDRFCFRAQLFPESGVAFLHAIDEIFAPNGAGGSFFVSSRGDGTGEDGA